MKFSKIVVDVNNWYHRNYAVNKNLTTTLEDGTHLVTGGIFGTVNTIKRLERDFGGESCQIFLLFDNATSGVNKRKEIDPDYKGNREKKDHTFYQGLDYLRFIFI